MKGRKKNGDVFPVQVGLNLYPWKSKCCVLVNVTDLSGIRHTETVRDRQLNWLKLSERLVPVGYWRIDVPSGALYWSENVFKIHGMSPSDPQPTVKEAIEFYHPEDREFVRSYVEQSIEDGKPYTFLYRVRTPDQGYKKVKSIGMPEFDENGKAIAVIGVFQDITREDAMGIELRDLTQKYEITSSDVVFMDVQMPGMSGNEVTRRLRASTGLNRDVLVVALTAKAFDRDREHCLSQGMNEFLAKPIEQQKVVEVLRNYFEFQLVAKAPFTFRETSAHTTFSDSLESAFQSEILDAARVNELRETLAHNFESAFTQLLEEFQATLLADSNLLEGLIEAKVYPRALKILHRMKGAALNLGFAPMAVKVLQIHQYLSREEYSQVDVLYKELQVEVERATDLSLKLLQC